MPGPGGIIPDDALQIQDMLKRFIVCKSLKKNSVMLQNDNRPIQLNATDPLLSVSEETANLAIAQRTVLFRFDIVIAIQMISQIQSHLARRLLWHPGDQLRRLFKGLTASKTPFRQRY